MAKNRLLGWQCRKWGRHFISCRNGTHHFVSGGACASFCGSLRARISLWATAYVLLLCCRGCSFDSMPPKKKAKLSGVTWEWKTDADEWDAFAPADAAMLEAHRHLGIHKTQDFTFNKDYQTMYEIDFTHSYQRNVETNVQRSIRRLEGGALGATASSSPVPTTKTGGVLYEWFTDDLTWEPFDPQDISLLEDALVASGTGKLFSTRALTFNKGYDSLYIFDFRLMTQMNCDSGTSRKIRRRMDGVAPVAEGDDDGVGYAVSDTKGVTPTAGATTAGSTPKAVKGVPTAPKAVVSTLLLPPPPEPLKDEEIKDQAIRGGQSRRGVKKVSYGVVVSKDKHGTACFDRMLDNEVRLCGEWAVFYHSYSAAALLYEVQAAVAAVLFRFRSAFAVLPRLLLSGFRDLCDAARLQTAFKKMKERDHNLQYRKVGLCATSALLADDSEAPAKSVFLMGYSVGPCGHVFTDLLTACGVPKPKVAALAKAIVALSVEHGLDARGFGGKACKSGRSGHLLQIFMKREMVDRYVYPSHPYGVPDKTRDKPLSKYLAGPGPIMVPCPPPKPKPLIRTPACTTHGMMHDQEPSLCHGYLPPMARA